MPSAMRFHQLLEALGRASIVLDQAEEPKRVHELMPTTPEKRVNTLRSMRDGTPCS